MSRTATRGRGRGRALLQAFAATANRLVEPMLTAHQRRRTPGTASASDIAGRQIDRVVVDDETWVAEATESGVPEAVARLTLSMFQATRGGHFSGSDPTLTRLLGREPRSITDQLKDLHIR